MNIFELMALLKIDSSSYKKGLKEAEQEGKDSSSRLGNTFGNMAGAIGKAFAAASAAAAGAVVALTKSAVGAYGNFEQLAGGVETLFKESSDQVMQYAKDAYKTAGLSANEYMETVTSFSASLLQSLGGDTAKAAEYADIAIRDMSDNANKMGTDMSMIQNAYQGFAKQNYTMLDNLKLGRPCQIAQYKPCENGETLALVA